MYKMNKSAFGLRATGYVAAASVLCLASCGKQPTVTPQLQACVDRAVEPIISGPAKYAHAPAKTNIGDIRGTATGILLRLKPEAFTGSHTLPYDGTQYDSVLTVGNGRVIGPFTYGNVAVAYEFGGLDNWDKLSESFPGQRRVVVALQKCFELNQGN